MVLERTARLDAAPTARDLAQLRWYLEDFPSDPHDPAPTLAEAARRRMRDIGVSMFTALRTTIADPQFAECLGAALADTSVEVVGRALPWELMRDPDTDRLPAVHARRMVHRTEARTARTTRLARDARMLLVVSRPQGDRDVRFQSVARPLLSTLDDLGAFDVEVLRPATYPRLLAVLSKAADRGRPFELVHFDGHGLMHDGRGHLVFESDRQGEAAWVPGGRLGKDLARAGVSVAVLNACRSADVGSGLDERTPVAFQSLAEELTHAGLAGVLAMQYDVRVDTAARLVRPLYAWLAVGRSLGEAATASRRELYTQMRAALAEGAVDAIDDWFVPIVYEVDSDTVPVQEQLFDVEPAPVTVGERYSSGFHGRDDVLLALDRLFDTTTVVALWGMAGVGKTATAHQFARWYAATGGVRGDVVIVPTGVRDVSERLLARLGGSLEHAIERFTQTPGFIVLDGVNAPPPEEIAGLVELIGQLSATGTRVLLTTHHAFWLKDVAHVRMTRMDEVDTLALLHDLLGTVIDTRKMAAWRPVLALANGNPLALRTLVEWADDLPNHDEQTLRRLVDDVLSGNNPPLPEWTRLALELWPQAFLHSDDWRQLTNLVHRQHYIDIDHIVRLGASEFSAHAPDTADISTDEWFEIFARVCVAGLGWHEHDTYFEVHPLLPAAISAGAGQFLSPEREEILAEGFVFLMASIGMSILHEYESGIQRGQSLKWARSEELNLRHAWEIALRRGWWDRIDGPMDGLHVGYLYAGRRHEWAGIVNQVAEQVVGTDGRPVPGREHAWSRIGTWLQDLALAEGDLATARLWAQRIVDYRRGLDSPYNVAVALLALGTVEIQLDDQQGLRHLHEARELVERDEESTTLLATIYFNLGLAYQTVTTEEDLRLADEHYRRSYQLQHPADRMNRAKCVSQIAEVLVLIGERLQDARDHAHLAPDVLDRALQTSADALHLLPGDAHMDRAVVLKRIARVHRMGGRYADALATDTVCRRHYEAAGDAHGAATSRLLVAEDLEGLGRRDDAIVYATAALAAFTALGEHGQRGGAAARKMLSRLGQ